MQPTNRLAEQLRTTRKAVGFSSIDRLAATMGVNKNTIGAYERGDTLPDVEFLAEFAKVTHADFYELLQLRLKSSKGEAAQRLASIIEKGAKLTKKEFSIAEPKAPSDEYALIPLYDVRAAAGHGAVVEYEEVIDSLAFKRQWVRQELNANPQDLYLIFVDGESMEPTLRPGDVILVDRRSAQSVPRDGIYVMRMDGSLLVKRMQRLPGHKVKVTSDNSAYEPFDLDLEHPEDDLAIIGRVVWSGRRM